MRSDNHKDNLNIGEDTLRQLSAMIGERMGLNYPRERWADLERGLRYAARDFGFSGEGSTRRCAEWLASAPLLPSQIDTLARHLTIGETYFFRDPAIFEALRTQILPDILRRHSATGTKELRIWSAACCTGEEPYSVAMLLTRILPTLVSDWKNWKITILATDLNPYFLRKAESGTYGAWSFRDGARDEQKLFFNPTPEGRFQLKPEIRQLVRFTRLNLVADMYPAVRNGTEGQDIIFCRNVLMYFSKDQARAVAERLIRCLNEGGYLIPSASEASPTLFYPLISVPFTGAILYHKSGDMLRSEGRLEGGRRTVTQQNVAGGNQNNIRRHSEANVAPTSSPSSGQSTDGRGPGRVTTGVVSHLSAGHLTLAASGDAPSKSTLPLKAPAQDWNAKARAAAGAGRLQEALEFCDHAISEDKMNARHHYLRASILLEQASHDAAHGAVASLRRALYLDPDFALAHVALGHWARRQQDASTARKAWQTALRLLRRHAPDALLAEADDLTAGRLAAIIERALEDLDEA